VPTTGRPIGLGIFIAIFFGIIGVGVYGPFAHNDAWLGALLACPFFWPFFLVGWLFHGWPPSWFLIVPLQLGYGYLIALAIRRFTAKKSEKAL
jgi:hypothetical protein